MILFTNITQRRSMCCAILTAVGAPLGLEAAKHKRYIGAFFELRSGKGLSATLAKTEPKRFTKYFPMPSRLILFSNDSSMSKRVGCCCGR